VLFNSLEYLAFLPVVVLAYYLAPSRARLWILLVASYVFYASWDPRYLVLIWALTVLNYFLGLALFRWRDHASRATSLLVLGLGIDLGALAYYKYSLFFLQNVQQSLDFLGFHAELPRPSIVLPLALSFFTFEFVHYLVDIRKGSPPVVSPLNFALFACFFPTQIAGPIKRFEQFVPQLEHPRSFDARRAGTGLCLIIGGLFKKTALADNLAPIVAAGFQRMDGGLGLPYTDAWLVVLAFAMQIYFDFSGYTDMGRGSAQLLGFDVPVNFNRPYLATSLSDFWRRWHISLSTWLRDYVYVSLGGNRRHQSRNLLVTMLLGGLWHGANWTFVIWGAFHGLLLSGYWVLRRTVGAGDVKRPLPVPGPIAWLLTFVCVCVGWVFFRAPTPSTAIAVLGSMAGLHAAEVHLLSSVQIIFVVAVVVGTLSVEWAQQWNERRRRAVNTATARAPVYAWSTLHPSLGVLAYAALLVLTALLMPSSGPRFIYFQF
jgi:alginate O-acetyltransferase complex protein AlgI